MSKHVLGHCLPIPTALFTAVKYPQYICLLSVSIYVASDHQRISNVFSEFCTNRTLMQSYMSHCIPTCTSSTSITTTYKTSKIEQFICRSTRPWWHVLIYPSVLHSQILRRTTPIKSWHFVFTPYTSGIKILIWEFDQKSQLYIVVR